MKNCIYKIVMILICAIISLPAMEVSQAEKEKKAKEEKINTCLAKFSKNPVPQYIVNAASFSKKNKFEVGELVIIREIIGKRNYWYACVTDVRTYTSGIFLGIKGNSSIGGLSGTYPPELIGKLQVPSLAELNIKNIVDQINARTLKIEDVEPPRLPQELYDRVKEALEKSKTP